MDRYFITRDNGREREVTVEEFVMAEREAGFNGPGHYSNPVSPATGSFSKTWYPNTERERNLSGRTEYVSGPQRESDWLLGDVK